MDDLTGAILDGRYRVLAPVAEGAMGVVYRAERTKLGRIVAIKVMHESLPSELSARQRFEIEAMAMSKLDHPHCAAVLDVGVHDGRPYVVMDFVDGENLKDVVARGRLPVVRVIEIMRQILSGLAHAHELGIVHRDIKPANIVLSQKAGLGDHVKVLDFGLARLADTTGPDGEQLPKLTVGMVVGTPSYMAPEQCTGGTVDGRTDLYACGVVLFELLTGHKPFVSEADDPVEVVRMHIAKPPPTLHDVTGQDLGPELEAIVARALAKKPDDRFVTAQAFTAALDVVRAQLISAPIAAASQPIAAPIAAPTAAPSQPITAPSQPITAPSPPISIEPSSPSHPSLPPSPSPPLPPSPRLSPRHKQLIAAAAGLLLLIIVIAIATRPSGKPAPPIDAAVAPPIDAGEIVVPSDPAGDTFARAQALADAGKTSQAIDLLVKGRAIFPTHAPMAYLAGKLYFSRLYWNDGIAAFRAALRNDPALRSDPELIKTVLRGFITTPDYNEDLAGFLRTDIGEASRTYLEETAKGHPNAQIRARASALLRRF